MTLSHLWGEEACFGGTASYADERLIAGDQAGARSGVPAGRERVKAAPRFITLSPFPLP